MQLNLSNLWSVFFNKDFNVVFKMLLCSTTVLYSVDVNLESLSYSTVYLTYYLIYIPMNGIVDFS